MTSQEYVLDAVLRAQGVLADYIEPGPRDCAKTLSRLFVIFADEELTDAVHALNLQTMSAEMRASENPPLSASHRAHRTTGSN